MDAGPRRHASGAGCGRRREDWSAGSGGVRDGTAARPFGFHPRRSVAWYAVSDGPLRPSPGVRPKKRGPDQWVPGDSLCDGSEGRIGFAIEPIAVVEYLDLVGPAIPLADEMGAGRNGPCGSGGAVAGCPVHRGSQRMRRVAAECPPWVRHWRSYARTRRRKTRESELGGVAPKVCSALLHRSG